MTTSREFAIDVTKTLQDAGFTALWAGGCVRDQLLQKTPKDYDVATSATPDQVRELFGKKRTLPIGAAFGVITVLGPQSADPIEIATFRRDTGYSDGRRPDAVEFTDAREDAIRRDFTINGMFYDPITDQVIDYVDGQEDLKSKIIRAIGNPHERIDEDKLRMLRAVRFASTFDFELESETLAAIQSHAAEIEQVSGERIVAELRRMFDGENRSVALRLLRESNLLFEILPHSEAFREPDRWRQVADVVARLDGDFSTTVSVLLDGLGEENVEGLGKRWKLSNEEKKVIDSILKDKSTLSRASSQPWSVVQPVLIGAHAGDTLKVISAEGGSGESLAFCLERLDWPIERLDPKPFLDGADLQRLEIPAGPMFGKILKAVRAAQLDGEISDQSAAEQIAITMAK